MFRGVDRAGFEAALEAAPVSPLFLEQYARFDPVRDWTYVDAMVHNGDLSFSGHFRVPAFCTLVAGNLDVDGVVDMETDYDEGGLLIVTGSVSCRHFISNHGANGFIDGDLSARCSIINGFEDSSLSVTGILTTRLFIGCDIWAEVGAGAMMDYGVGYCLPIGYADARAEAIRPRHTEAETAQVVIPGRHAQGHLLSPQPFAKLIRAGKPIFR